MNCTNGLGFRENHPAEGWIVSPERRRIMAMCRRDAEAAIGEYMDVLGEVWTFEEDETIKTGGA